jgi:hypothetical protein
VVAPSEHSARKCSGTNRRPLQREEPSNRIVVNQPRIGSYSFDSVVPYRSLFFSVNEIALPTAKGCSLKSAALSGEISSRFAIVLRVWQELSSYRTLTNSEHRQREVGFRFAITLILHVACQVALGECQRLLSAPVFDEV